MASRHAQQDGDAAADDGDHVRRDGRHGRRPVRRLNDGKIVFYPELVQDERLGQLRERMFVAAPITYSAYRFVRSLYGNKGYASF